MLYEVDVDTTEEATIQYTALVEAVSGEDAIRKVNSAIKNDGTAFLEFDCIETRVVDTQKLDQYQECVEWEEGHDTSWVARVHTDNKPRMAIVIDNGTPLYVYATQFKTGEFEAEVGIINFDTGGTEAEDEFQSVEMDTSMVLVYSREEK
jgi:hypothetical protein